MTSIAAVVRPQRVDAVRHDLERIDIEAGIGFIQDRQLGFEQRHLQDFGALFLAAGEPDIDRTPEHFGIDLQAPGGVLDHAHEIGRRDLGFLAMLALGVERRLEEGHGGDARHFDRVLEGEEQAGGGAFVHFESKDGHLPSSSTSPSVIS